MAGTRKSRGEARREQILDVAMRAFAEQGFRGASLAAIAAEAGISEPGLLHHFASKRELLFGVLQGTEAEFKAWASDRIAGGRGYTELLLDVARHHETDPSFIRFFVVLSAESLESCTRRTSGSGCATTASGSCSPTGSRTTSGAVSCGPTSTRWRRRG